jgi:hypothetical protein
MTNVHPPPPFGICSRHSLLKLVTSVLVVLVQLLVDVCYPFLDPRVMSVEMAEVYGGSGIPSLGPAR